MSFEVPPILLADMFIKKYGINDEGTQFCVRLTFEGYYACIKDIDRDSLEFRIYTHEFKKYCDRTIASND